MCVGVVRPRAGEKPKSQKKKEGGRIAQQTQQPPGSFGHPPPSPPKAHNIIRGGARGKTTTTPTPTTCPGGGHKRGAGPADTSLPSPRFKRCPRAHAVGFGAQESACVLSRHNSPNDNIPRLPCPCSGRLRYNNKASLRAHTALPPPLTTRGGMGSRQCCEGPHPHPKTPKTPHPYPQKKIPHLPPTSTQVLLCALLH